MNKLNPFETGFYATLVLQGIEESLKAPLRENNGVKIGKEIDLKELIFNEIGENVLLSKFDPTQVYGVKACADLSNTTIPFFSWNFGWHPLVLELIFHLCSSGNNHHSVKILLEFSLIIYSNN